MNLEKIQEMWAKDSEAFFDHRELPELLANDSMETPRLHAKYVQFYNSFKLMLSEAQVKKNVLYRMKFEYYSGCLLYTSPSPRDRQKSRMPSSA